VGLTGLEPRGWGILGGTFDPIHYAHLAIAEQARDQLGLGGILFVPARMPPHKLDLPMSDAQDRLRMVELAVADDPAFYVSDLELRRRGPSYTVDTAEELVRELGTDPWFILSTEALRELPSWHRPQRLLELVRLAVMPRLGAARPDVTWLEEHFPGQASRISFLEGPELGDSASAVRRLAAGGRSIRYLVPPAVEGYIREHALYRPAAPAPVPDPHAPSGGSPY
jgi:nicotinate-nucleotide adenylyltransferase